jgi:hypothetical protein
MVAFHSLQRSCFLALSSPFVKQAEQTVNALMLAQHLGSRRGRQSLPRSAWEIRADTTRRRDAAQPCPVRGETAWACLQPSVAPDRAFDPHQCGVRGS